MASPIHRINTLKVEISNLEFRKEMFLQSHAYDIYEVINIDEILAGLKARDTQIAELQSRLDELLVALPVTEAINLAIHNRQTRPPISSLPYEMLSAVFEKGSLSASYRTKFALSVSQVSRYWRETAMQTPFLWSNICLLPWRNRGGYREFLKILVQRSQPHPLDIAVTLREFDNPQSNFNRMMAILHPAQESQSSLDGIAMSLNQPEVSHHCLQAQLDIVVPEVARWRSFIYKCDHPDDVLEVTEHLADLFAPILESFDLSVDSYNEWGDEREPWNVFEGGAPMLSHVHYGGIEPAACLPPLSSLTSLHLQVENRMNTIGGAEFLGILRSSPALVSLDLEGTVVEPACLHRLAQRGQNVEIATLRSFSFSANASPKYCIESILNTILCPALESLTISGFEPDFDNPDPVPIQAPPLPPFSALRSIKLEGITCTDFVEHFDFTHLRVLDTISLISCTSPMALLCPLLLSQGSPDNVWPALQVIKLSHLGAEEFDGLSEVILHRQACGKPIKAVALDPVSLTRFSEKVKWMKQRVAVQRGEIVHYPLVSA